VEVGLHVAADEGAGTVALEQIEGALEAQRQILQSELATQEILVRVVTRLSQFDFRNRLKTWVYRVAFN